MSGARHPSLRRGGGRLALLFAVTAATAACHTIDPPIQATTIFFPHPAPHDGPTVMMAALGSGTLTFEDGCLWLRTGEGRDLIIWSPLFRLDTRGGGIAVRDGRGAVFAEVGRPITIGGGEVTNEGSAVDVNVWIESKIGRTIPAACRIGRYWDAAGGPANVP